MTVIYNAHYNSETGQILSFHFPDVLCPEPFVAVDEAVWQRHVDGAVVVRIDVETGTVVEGAAPDRPLYPDLETARVAFIAQIDEIMRRVTGPVSIYERNSWPSKAEAARSVLAGVARPDQAALLSGEATERGEELAVVAARIVANAAKYEGVISRMSGLRGMIEKDLEAADPAQFETIIETGIARAASALADLGVSISVSEL